MANKTFTATSVAAIKAPRSGRVERYDSAVPGFGVRVTAAGAKSWIFVYSHHGRRRRYTIGPVAVLPLADARATAVKLRDRVKAGGDPAAEKNEASAQRQAEVADKSGTFGVVSETYFRRHGDNLVCGAEMRQIVEQKVLPHWRDRKVTEISRYDVAEVCGALVDAGKPGAAHRLFGVVRGIFNYAVSHALVRGLEASPCDRMNAPTARVKRDRILDDDEIRRVWQAFGAMGAPFGEVYKVLLLTGQRLAETCRMTWDNVDLDTGEWLIPATDAKNSTAHTVRLAPQALEVVAAQPRMSRSPYVFAGRGDSPLSGHGRAKRSADDLSGVTGWRLHDLRRTVRSGMAKLGVPVAVAEMVLNHSLGGLISVYDQHHYRTETADAWNRWAQHIAGLVYPPDKGKVVPMRRQASAAD